MIHLPPCPLAYLPLKPSAALKAAQLPWGCQDISKPKGAHAERPQGEALSLHKRERCLTNLQVLQLPTVPALVSFWLQLLETLSQNHPDKPLLNSSPIEAVSDNKMTNIVLSHLVWKVICYRAWDNQKRSSSRHLAIFHTFSWIAWLVLGNCFSDISVTKHNYLHLLVGISHVKHLSCCFTQNMNLWSYLLH